MNWIHTWWGKMIICVLLVILGCIIQHFGIIDAIFGYPIIDLK
jgi:hypothetical protein